MPKELLVRQEPTNPHVRHFLVPMPSTTQFVRGREVPLKPDIRLQSTVTPILMNSNVVDAHAKRGQLTVFVRDPANWDDVEPKVIDKIYEALGISDKGHGKLAIKRL